MFKKKTQTPQTKIEKRVASLPTQDLTGWAEQALYTIGRYLTDYIKSGDTKVLDEAELGAEALLAVVRELKKRA